MHIGIASPISTDSLKDYLILGDEYPKGLGGPSINKLISGFLEEGHNVSVYSLDSSIKQPVELKGDNLKIYYGVYRNPARKRMIDFFYHESNQIRKFIQNDRPDIVNAHWGYEYAVGTIKSEYPHLITLRDFPLTILRLQKDIYRVVRLLMNLWVIKNGRNFSVNSPYLEKKYGAFLRYLPVIPNSIPEKYITDKPKRLCGNKIRMISILTGWGKIKNAIPAIKAYSILKKEFKNLEYHFFGYGYEPDGLANEWIRKNNPSDDIFLHGQIAHEELMNELSSFDILVHPSREESFGNTLIEAMAAGLPVIGGKNSGAVKWVLNYGKNGILVDINTHLEIYRAIKGLINDNNLYEKLSQDGIEYVKEYFSNKMIVKKYLGLYQKILR